MIFKTQSQFLEYISRLNFVTNPLSQIIEGLDKIEEQHSKIDKERSSLNYDIYGLAVSYTHLTLPTNREV